MVPSSAATSRTQSWSPTLTPALLTTRSDVDAASSIAAHRVLRIASDAEERRSAAGFEDGRGEHRGVGVDELRRPGGRARRDQLVPGGEQGDARSRPDHEHGRDPARRRHRCRCWSSGCPGRITVSPARMSAPRGRTLVPSGVATSMSTSAPSRDVSSWRTTVSAPSGIGAPVMIRIAVPATCASGTAPARDSPATGRRTGAPRRRLRDLARAHRVSVHRRVVEPGELGSRRDRLSEDHVPAPYRG